MPQLLSKDVEGLRTAMGGQVLTPADPGYDEARTLWNGDIDRRPAVIARCASAGDVVAALGFARERGLEVAVRGGAHSTSGLSGVDDGLVVDLSPMHSVTVDPDARTAVVDGGARLSDLDAATQANGLATPAGLISHTGVGGLLLGGGMGWLTRKAGLTVDNLEWAEIVTADGQVLRTSAQEHPDLFWAIRGGGGNFGVATRFGLRLHPVGPLVDFGLFFWGLDEGRRVLELARDVLEDLSPDVDLKIVAVNLPPAPFVPEEHWLRPGYALLLGGFDAPEEHAAVVEQLREAAPVFEMVEQLPYTAMQQLFDEANAFGVHAYDKSVYVEDLTADVVDVVTEYVARKQSPMSVVFFYRLDQAYSEVADDATAFGGGRSPRFCVFMIGVTDATETLPAEREWVRSFFDALQPYALGAGYLNGETDFPDERVRNTFGAAKYERLARVKATYDPQNTFRRNANILPAPQPPRQRAPGA
jgi:FAD/FMN-containing dehydrogenase